MGKTLKICYANLGGHKISNIYLFTEASIASKWTKAASDTLETTGETVKIQIF